MTQDSRGAPRARPRPDEPVDVQLMSDHFLDLFEARDISITGVGIFVPYRFEDCDLRSVVDLVITLPGARPFLAKGRVIHRSKTDREFFGVEFVDITDVQRGEIGRYVARLLSGERSEESDSAS